MYDTRRRRLFGAARRGAATTWARRPITSEGSSWPVSSMRVERAAGPLPAVTSRDGLPAGLARPGRATCTAREARRRSEAEEGAVLLDAALGGAPFFCKDRRCPRESRAAQPVPTMPPCPSQLCGLADPLHTHTHTHTHTPPCIRVPPRCCPVHRCGALPSRFFAACPTAEEEGLLISKTRYAYIS